jgi:hypothetical protein
MAQDGSTGSVPCQEEVGHQPLRRVAASLAPGSQPHAQDHRQCLRGRPLACVASGVEDVPPSLAEPLSLASFPPPQRLGLPYRQRRERTATGTTRLLPGRKCPQGDLTRLRWIVNCISDHKTVIIEYRSARHVYNLLICARSLRQVFMRDLSGLLRAMTCQFGFYLQ